jgi:predicted HicB family RNase H-like nuclease
MNQHYTYRVTWSKEDDAYVGLCAEFPSLSWIAQSEVEAFTGIYGVVSEVLQDMEKEGEKIPTAIADRNYSGKFNTRVSPELHRKLVLEAAEENISLSKLVNYKLAV